MKKRQIFLLSLLAVILCACQTVKKPDQDIVILFENDVHCAIDGYTKFGALKQEMLSQTPYVAVVSAGDFVQGAALGSITRGESIIKIMNAVGYDVTTIGNHEFDYGVDQMKHLMSELKADVVCCNFTDLNDKQFFPSYVIKQFGDVKVAFVGAATPTTFTSSTPTFFEDASGKLIYSFHADNCFKHIEKAAKEARSEGADYVIVLSHLGDDTEIDNSVDMIRSTTGIDAVLDGHQHHIINQTVSNKSGKPIHLASTGTAFLRMGKLTINTNGEISVDLIRSDSYKNKSEEVAQVINDIEAQLEDRINAVVGHTEVPLTMFKFNDRETRRGETNLADLLADAFRDQTGADVGMLNGGGIRNQIDAGPITFGEIYSVMPFNNSVCMVECTGQQILDAIEMGVSLAPEENGSFMQVSGLRYSYDPSIPTSVKYDINNLFIGIGDTRRVTSVEVENKETGEWEPLDVNKTYTVGGQSYILQNKGAEGVFRTAKKVACAECNGRTDVQAVIDYLQKIGRITAKQYGKPQQRITVVKH